MAVAPTVNRRQALTLGALAGVNLVGGFAMHWYLLAVVGPSGDTDALFASLALPQALLAIVASSFMTVLLPLLSGDTDEEFRRNAWTFTSLTLVTFSALAAALAMTSHLWVPLLAPGLSGQSRDLAVQLSRIQLIGMVCTALAGVFGTVHRVRRNFVWVESVPVISTVCAAAFLVAFLPRYGVHAAAWAWVIRIGLNAALLAPGVGRFDGLTTDRATLATLWRRLRPLVVGTAYMKTEPLFDRGVVSLAPPGELSLFYLCQQVCFAAVLVAHNALVAPVATSLALHAKAGRWDAFSALRRRSSRIVFGMAALAFGAMVAVAVLLLQGLLPVAPTPAFRHATWIMLGLSGVFVVGPVYESMRSALYSTGSTSSPVRLEAAVFTCGLLLKVVGFWALGVFGLALAASAQSVIGVSVLQQMLSAFERREGGAAVQEQVKTDGVA